MILYNKITFQQHLVNRLSILFKMLHYLPFCKTSHERDSILQEIRNIRYEITEIEEMTKSEKQKYVKWKVMTIESDLN